MRFILLVFYRLSFITHMDIKFVALNKCIGLLLALSVYGVVAINEPVEKVFCLFARNDSHQLDDIVLCKTVRGIPFTVGSRHFQLTTRCSQLISCFLEARLQYAPVLARIFLRNRNI